LEGITDTIGKGIDPPTVSERVSVLSALRISVTGMVFGSFTLTVKVTTAFELAALLPVITAVPEVPAVTLPLLFTAAAAGLLLVHVITLLLALLGVNNTGISYTAPRLMSIDAAPVTAIPVTGMDTQEVQFGECGASCVAMEAS
jgi:hypothetical protein